MDPSIKMIILNITTWPMDIAYPQLYYGYLIFCTDPRANFQNIRAFDVSSLGKVINVTHQLGLDDARRLDKMDGTTVYESAWQRGERESCRFEDMEMLMKAGLQAYEALETDVPFISLLDGGKFSGTLTRNENEQYYLPRYTYAMSLDHRQALTPGSPFYDAEFASYIDDGYGSAEAYLHPRNFTRLCREIGEMIMFDTDSPY